MAHVAIFAPNEDDVERLHMAVVEALMDVIDNDNFPYVIKKHFLAASHADGPLRGLNIEVGTIILKGKT